MNGDQANQSVKGAGAVYVFKRTAGRWSQEAYLKAPSTSTFALFGTSVALDGDTLAVGAIGEASLAGGVYVFSRTAGRWAPQASLSASNARSSALFGSAVALSGDLLAVGAPGESSKASGVNGDQSDTSAPDAGAVYLFRRGAATWSQEAFVKASNTRLPILFLSRAKFGTAVAVSGTALAVGAPGEASNATGVNGDQSDTSAGGAGAVYVFAKALGGWSQRAYVKPARTTSGMSFGAKVAISGDTLAVGAPAESSSASGVNGNAADLSASESGAVYVFAGSPATLAQQAYLKASNTRARAHFGDALAIFGDNIAVGAPGEGSSARGVGGNQADDSAPGAGAVYLLTRAGGAWSQGAYVKASTTAGGDAFGRSVALAGDALAVGAPNESGKATGVGGAEGGSAASGSGAAYVF